MALSGAFLDFYSNSEMRHGTWAWYRAPADAGRDAAPLMILEPADPSEPRLDLSTAALAAYREKLGARGRLLIAFENPYSLRYFAGHTAANTGRSFDTLFGRGARPLPGKAEMARRLIDAGFEEGAVKWYYPLSDHWLTTEVYSDACLPNEFFGQRLVDYLDDDEGRLYDERPLLRETVRSGTFTLMCPAYIVEARADARDAECPVEYAAVTAYREPAKRFVTSVLSDGTVRKRALHRDGAASLERLVSNHAELRAAGLNLIECAVDGGAELVMSRIPLPTLADYWSGCVRAGNWDAGEVIRLFDRIVRDIKTASDATRKAWWELVPANCFYDAAARGEEGELLYFDQEYCTAGADPRLAVARSVSGLRYAPALSDSEEVQELYRELLARYDLAGERDFIAELSAANTYIEVFGDEHRRYQELTRAHAARL
jgi:hypothetical protein